MAKESIFDYESAREYLRVKLATTGASRGLRTTLADLTHTKPAFISRCLSGDLHFAPEHVPAINSLLQHNDEESRFFLLLLMFERAGNNLLEKMLKTQIDEILEKRRQISERMKNQKSIRSEDQAVYLSRWYYQAIHVLTNIPAFQTKTAIAKRLRLSLSTVSSALDFLKGAGFVKQSGEKFSMGTTRLHIGKDSVWLSQLHQNIRQRSIHSLSEPTEDDMHYSLTMSISKKDQKIIRDKLIKLVEEIEPILRDSKDEELFILSLDCFQG